MKENLGFLAIGLAGVVSWMVILLVVAYPDVVEYLRRHGWRLKP